MTWLLDGEKAALHDVFGLRPDLYARYREFASLFWSRRSVEPVLLELCRLRVARLLGCAPMPAAGETGGPSEGRLAALEDWVASDAFTERERACLAFTDRFILDPHAITDDDAAAVARHLPAAEMVAFTEALALFDGFTRFCAILGIDTDNGPLRPQMATDGRR
jgi:alkylhydroperoxidase family enzyme